MSDIRIIAVWHYGNDRRIVDAIAPNATDVLTGIDPRMPVATIADMLGRPNDVHRAIRVEWSWWTICQTWAFDTRDADDILTEAFRHDSTPPGQTKRDYAHPFSCWYGCRCGAFPTDANYCQDLAIDRCG